MTEGVMYADTPPVACGDSPLMEGASPSQSRLRRDSSPIGGAKAFLGIRQISNLPRCCVNLKLNIEMKIRVSILRGRVCSCYNDKNV